MKIFLPFLILLFLSKVSFSQSFGWSQSFGSANGDDKPNSIKTDENGNVYTAGTFTGVLNYNVNGTPSSMTSYGFEDMFLSKSDSSGNIIWMNHYGGMFVDECSSIFIDNAGNIYATGSFSYNGSFYIDTSFTGLDSYGGADCFIAKIDPTGTLVWVKQIGGPNDDKGMMIKLDSNNDILISGFFNGTADFDPSSNNYLLTELGTSTTATDAFIAKYDSSGNFVWAKQFGGSLSQTLLPTLGIDSLGNVYGSGTFEFTADFDPSSNVQSITSNGARDVFLLKLDDGGEFIWSKRIGSNFTEFVGGIDLNNGKIAITGSFSLTTDFDLGAGIYNLTALGSTDAFVAEYDLDGGLLWAKQFGGTALNNVITQSIKTDIEENVYVCGRFSGPNDFDPGADSLVLTPNGQFDAFFSKWDADGNLVWVHNVGGSDLDFAQSITTFNNEVYVAGIFKGTVDLNPFSGITTAISNGSYDGFILKFGGSCTESTTIYEQSCGPYVWSLNGNIYSNTGQYIDTVVSSVGCDSIVTLNLTIFNSTSNQISHTACDSYMWSVNGQIYTASGQYIDTIPNAAGCDSIITLNLTILNSSVATETQTACGSFTWPINGQTYTASGQYIDTIPNAAGCDSIITLDLTIIPDLPLTIENSFSMPSDANSCTGEVAVTVSGNADFELDFDNGSQVITSSGYSLVTGLCPGTHDLHVTDNCGDTLSTTVVIPVDSNFVFNNPFIDSLAQDSLGVTLTNCDIYYAGIDTAYIDSIWATGNTVNVIWNIVDSNGSNFDTTSYVLNNGNGVYWLQLSVFCPNKSVGEYFTVTEAIYFNNGSVSTAGLPDIGKDLFAIYPNPTNDLVHISFSGSDAELTVYDVQGKVVLKDHIQNNGIVSLQSFERGVYLFDFNNSQGHSVQRVVKQ
ncbi:MAG: SBBP repeat-containing protein [Fluviicola sp.]